MFPAQVLKDSSMAHKVNQLLACAGARQTREKVRKLGQLQPFLAVFPQECMGQLASSEPT
jgi:hypothetical protein